MIPFHPLAELFPPLDGQEFASLVEDIRDNGVRDPIILYDGAVLDGRNRYRALVALRDSGAARGRGWGVYENEPVTDEDLSPGAGLSWFERYSPMIYGEPLAFVISKNLKRRHLDESQRAFVAAKLANMPRGRPPADDGKPANLPVKQSEAAGLLNVSERSVRSAVAVQEGGTKELQRAVEQGHLKISSAAQAVRLSPEMQRQIAADAEAGRDNAVRSAIKKEARSARESDLGARQCALPQEKFGIILADPEWRFEPWSRETGLDRAADNHYPTSATEVIASRDVLSIAANDSILWLWATVPMLPHALLVMGAWGFDYRSHFIWNKDRIGTGYWNRNRHELLLLGVRGKVPAPAMGTQWDSVIDAAVGEHSAKPEKFPELIEFYFPTLPKIELNRRGPARPGWKAWGNETVDPVTGETKEGGKT